MRVWTAAANSGQVVHRCEGEPRDSFWERSQELVGTQKAWPSTAKRTLHFFSYWPCATSSADSRESASWWDQLLCFPLIFFLWVWFSICILHLSVICILSPAYQMVGWLMLMNDFWLSMWLDLCPQYWKSCCPAQDISKKPQEPTGVWPAYHCMLAPVNIREISLQEIKECCHPEWYDNRRELEYIVYLQRPRHLGNSYIVGSWIKMQNAGLHTLAYTKEYKHSEF